MKTEKTSVKSEMAIAVNRLVKAIVRRALAEDLGVRGDITSKATVGSDQTSQAVIMAKSEGIIAGQFVAETVFKSLDKRVKYEILVQDGSAVKTDETITRLSGPTRAILSGERVALNLLGRCCGIATATHRYVEAVNGTGAKICETRKTAPGLRFLDKAAVRVGGGVNHRYALYDAFLIKENHVAASGGITKAIEACRQSVWGKKLRIMVEVRNIAEFLEAWQSGPDRILLDNMKPTEIANCKLQIARFQLEKKIELEATGGITLSNIREYAETGVDYISVGSLTHSVNVMDLSLLIKN